MKKRKHIVILLLMISSMILLITLQALWLVNSYEKAFYDLKREANDIFRSTVYTMRDSLISKNILAVSSDSVHGAPTVPPSVVAYGRTREVDSVRLAEPVGGAVARDEKVRIYITSQEHVDSLSRDMLKPVMSRIQHYQLRNTRGAKSFVVRLGADTLDRDSLRHEFGKALASASFNLPFEIYHIIRPPSVDRPDFFPDFVRQDFHRGKDNVLRDSDPVFSDTLHVEPVRLNPLHHYATSLTDVRGKLLAEITPQIFFSLFLTVMILFAFLTMYLNMRSQQRLMELKNDFISNVTHELKTPVATVSVALEALKNFQARSNPKLAAEYLDIAQGELNRLTLMTDKILRTAIFENRGVEFKPEPINLDETVQQVITSMKLVFEKRGASIQYIKEGSNFEMQGGLMHITHVIYNLLDNALKYSLKNPFILVTLKGATDKLILLVEDRGIGIPKEYHKKIFEKFFRVPTGDVHNAKGHGLGLNYVASVVKSHGGKIEVESAEGVGSVFRIEWGR
jgi:two-component system, OmpR family, phosphate regulon sensor histidine kinase PhoR